MIHNEATPIVVMWPIRKHNFIPQGLTCIFLLLLVRVKVNRSNFTTGHVIREKERHRVDLIRMLGKDALSKATRGCLVD